MGLSLIQLAVMVRDMRLAQVEYFKTRSGSALAASKAAERRVDLEVKRVLEDAEKLNAQLKAWNGGKHDDPL